MTFASNNKAVGFDGLSYRFIKSIVKLDNRIEKLKRKYSSRSESEVWDIIQS